MNKNISSNVSVLLCVATLFFTVHVHAMYTRPRGKPEFSRRLSHISDFDYMTGAETQYTQSTLHAEFKDWWRGYLKAGEREVEHTLSEGEWPRESESRQFKASFEVQSLDPNEVSDQRKTGVFNDMSNQDAQARLVDLMGNGRLWVEKLKLCREGIASSNCVVFSNAMKPKKAVLAVWKAGINASLKENKQFDELPAVNTRADIAAWWRNRFAKGVQQVEDAHGAVERGFLSPLVRCRTTFTAASTTPSK